MATSLDNQKALTKEVLAAEEKWDIEAIVSTRTNDCLHQILPTTLGIPQRNNNGFKEYYATLKPIFSAFKINILQAIHDSESHVSAIQCVNYGDTAVGAFEMESTWILEFTADGTKVRRVEEIVDSKYLTEFLGKLPQPENESN